MSSLRSTARHIETCEVVQITVRCWDGTISITMKKKGRVQQRTRDLYSRQLLRSIKLAVLKSAMQNKVGHRRMKSKGSRQLYMYMYLPPVQYDDPFWRLQWAEQRSSCQGKCECEVNVEG
jgi:hypothetical protein